MTIYFEMYFNFTQYTNCKQENKQLSECFLSNFGGYFAFAGMLQTLKYANYE